MCFRKFWDPKMFKNRPPDRLWAYFLYQTVSKNHARLTGGLRITRKPQNYAEIGPKIFLLPPPGGGELGSPLTQVETVP